MLGTVTVRSRRGRSPSEAHLINYGGEWDLAFIDYRVGLLSPGPTLAQTKGGDMCTKQNKESVDLFNQCSHLSTSVRWVNLELARGFLKDPAHLARIDKEQKKLVRNHFNNIIRNIVGGKTRGVG